MAKIREFWTSESGVVTVDWVVLTGAAVGIGLAVMMVVADGLNTAANSTADQLASLDVGFSFDDAWSSGWGTNEVLNPYGFTAAYIDSVFEDMSDAQLTQYHGIYSTYATDGRYGESMQRLSVDVVGSIESQMNARGMEIPSGPTYDEMYAGFG